MALFSVPAAMLTGSMTSLSVDVTAASKSASFGPARSRAPRLRDSVANAARLFKVAKGAAFISAAMWSSHAAAALNWCQLTTLFPSASTNFEQSAQAIDQLSCRSLPTESAHFRMWECSDIEADDTVVYLERLQTGYRGGTILTVQSERENLDHLRTCPGIGRSGTTFDRESIGWIDEVTRKTDRYSFTGNSIALFALAGSSFIAGGTSDKKDVAAYVERNFFGYQRPTLATSSVELGGKDLFGTPVQDIVDALVARGSEIRSDDSEGDIFRTVKMSAPVGLEGVSEIAIQGLRRHVWRVTYDVPSQASYEALVAALDSKYGRSERANSTNKGCSYREWATGSYNAVEIIGEYCPNGSHVWFKNVVADGQLQAYREFLDEMSKRSDEKKKPVIDRDNI